MVKMEKYQQISLLFYGCYYCYYGCYYYECANFGNMALIDSISVPNPKHILVPLTSQ